MTEYRMIQKPKDGDVIQYIGVAVPNWNPEWTAMLPHGEYDLVGFVEIFGNDEEAPDAEHS